jgi:hypothetical protein
MIVYMTSRGGINRMDRMDRMSVSLLSISPQRRSEDILL